MVVLFTMSKKCNSLYLYQQIDRNLKFVVNIQPTCHLSSFADPLFVNLCSLKYLFIIPESIFVRLWHLFRGMYRTEICKSLDKILQGKDLLNF